MKVYLSGHVEYVPYYVAAEWRKLAKTALNQMGCVPVDPVGQFMKYRKDPQVMVEKELDQLRTADWLLVNGQDLVNRGVGTFMEMGIAFERGIPIMVFGGGEMERNHPFLQVLVSRWVANLEEALELLSREKEKRGEETQEKRISSGGG